MTARHMGFDTDWLVCVESPQKSALNQAKKISQVDHDSDQTPCVAPHARTTLARQEKIAQGVTRRLSETFVVSMVKHPPKQLRGMQQHSRTRAWLSIIVPAVRDRRWRVVG
ncbi:MAG: hypothetical protein KatS3mg110_1068 [Pirellulaceae bacterium]|nr:MAG: hypothetical protein KatS3mg110_1068 [Pirellulaceae bacterium]